MHPIAFGKIQATFKVAYEVSIKMFVFQGNEQRFFKGDPTKYSSEI